ncbi:MAG: hypothetical protein IJO40_03445 [Thermoguttaceae bacterium]|nr:hypothetical protein [Thermoguttaceae bacterium]
MNVSNASAPCAADSLESTRRLFQNLFERLVRFTDDAPNANERANAAVKSLEVLRLESQFFPRRSLDLSAPSVDDWRRRVETALAAVVRDVATVESKSERAYLRRLALDAALSLNACDETFFTEPFADALLAEIDDAEERQNALVAYSTRLAERVSRFRKRDGSERAKAFAALEEIEDLRLFERAAANVVAAVIFNATQNPDATNDAPFQTAPLDLTPFGDDVAETWEQFESPGGFLELSERASFEVFERSRNAPATPAELALRQALSVETRRRLEAILASLDSGLADDGSPLNEDERAELQNVVDEAVIVSPFALSDGEFYRALLERNRNLDAFVPIFERLAEAENATDALFETENAPSKVGLTAYRQSLYRCLTLNGAEEKTRWLDSARQVATRSLTFEGDLRVKLDRLTTWAEIEFRFGDKTDGKTAVRETLGLLPRLGSPFERARLYRRLVAIHLDASYSKAAQKLASLWKAELDAIEPEDLRDAALGDAFDLYAKAVKQDPATLSAFCESLSAPLARLEVETRLRLALLFSPEDAPNVAAVVRQFANLADSTVAKLQTLDEVAPDEAIFTLVKIATAFAARLAVVSSVR